MNPYAILAALALIIALTVGSYFKGRHDEAAVAVEHERNSLLAYAEQIRKGVEQHDEDQRAINALHAQLAGMLVPLPPICPGAAKDPNGKAGLLYGAANAAFAELQRGDNEDFARCDQLNIDAIRANAGKGK